jgi:hypothetical protein
MTKTPSEIYQAMNATNILVAILETQKKISIPIDIFLNASKEDKNLNVEYNEESSSFVFELRDKNEQQDDNQDAESDSNE